MDDYLLTLLNQSGIGYAIHEMIYNEEGRAIDYRFLNVNRAGLTIMEADETVIGSTMMTWSRHSPAMIPWVDKYAEVVDTGEVISFEMYSEALERWFSVTACKVGEGKFASSFYDITEYVETKREADLALKQFENILKHTSDLVAFMNHDHSIQYMNDDFCDYFGVKCKDVVAENFFSLFPTQKREAVLGLYQSIIERDDRRQVVFNQGNEVYEYVEWQILEIFDAERKSIGYLLVGHDVTNQEKEKIELYKTLYLDSLTGLANKNYLIENFESLIRADVECLAGVFIDLDNFKLVNDLFGHDAGNEFLILIADRLTDLTDNRGVVVRLSGDEFFILINDLHTKEELTLFVESIFEEFSTPLSYEECSAPIFVNFSMGIACYPDDSKGVDELITHADIAMYSAKQNGKNNYKFYDESLEKEVFDSFYFLQDIINALRNEEFLAHYQPVLETNSMKVTEVEALGRWDHPIHGILPARRFIKLTKVSGYLGQFTNQVVQRVAEDMRAWQERGIDSINVSLNIAIQQLEKRSFAGLVEKTFEGIDFSRLRVQITEEDVVEANEVVLDNLKKLKAMGVLISLNDFNLNHAAISKLEDLNFDIIKLNKTFSHNINDNEYSKIVIEMMQRLVKAFDKECIVQGVETEEQYATMRELDFHVMQGYYFSDALSGEDFLNSVDFLDGTPFWKS